MPDNTQSLTKLSDLLLDLQQNPKQPYKMSALRGAKNIFMPDEAPKPAGNPGSGLVPQGSEEDVADEYRLRSQMPPGMDDLQISPPPIPSFSSVQSSGEAGGASGVQNTGQGSGYTNKHILDSPESESRPGFFKSDQFKNIANMGAGLLGGALGGALSGNWRAGMAGGGAVQLKDFQDKQKDMLDRRHKAWESAYNEASALPADIHTTPGMEEVAKAQQALMKDLQDGKVDNEQNLTNFLKVKAMYGGDIEKMAMDRKMADQKRVEDENFQNDAMRKSQRAESLQRIAADPMTPDAQKQAALAELATINKDLEMQRDRDATRQVEADRWAKTAEHQQRMEGLQQQGYNVQLAGQQSRERNVNAQIQSRERIAQKAQFGNRVKAMVSQAMRNEPEVGQSVHYANAIKALGGVEMTSPGNLVILGERVPMMSILGNRPALWDHDGTPTEEGWNVIYAAVGNDIESAIAQANQPQPLSLTDAYGQ